MIHDKVDEPWKHFTKCKKPDVKGQILYDSIYMKYSEFKKTETWIGYQELGYSDREELLTGSGGLFGGDENVLELDKSGSSPTLWMF